MHFAHKRKSLSAAVNQESCDLVHNEKKKKKKKKKNIYIYILQSIKPLQLIQNAAARLIFNEPKRMHVTPLFINLHWLPIAARIKFKALMFAYKTTSGSAPLYLNSLLQTYVPSRSLLQVNDTLLFIPKRHKITFTDFFINCSHLVEWPAQLNPSSWILTHLQETAKNTSLPSLFDPLTLALSILILFYLSVFFLFKKNTYTHLTLYKLHIYSVTASCSWKTNTSFLFSILSTCFFKKKTLGFFFLYSIYSFSLKQTNKQTKKPATCTALG